jgi:hypothetical protein
MGTAFPLFTTQLYGARPRPRVAARDGDTDAPAYAQTDLGSAGATRCSRSSPRRSRPSRTCCSSTARSSARGASSPGRWYTTHERGATGAQVRRHFTRYPKADEIDEKFMQSVKYIANNEDTFGVQYSVPESRRIACRIMDDVGRTHGVVSWRRTPEYFSSCDVALALRAAVDLG